MGALRWGQCHILLFVLRKEARFPGDELAINKGRARKVTALEKIGGGGRHMAQNEWGWLCGTQGSSDPKGISRARARASGVGVGRCKP